MPNFIEGDVVYEEFLQGEVRADVLAPALEKFYQMADATRQCIKAWHLLSIN